ncbi:MAG: hypothetical protein OQL19_08500 [Gammaproteobacteria bacterium]|nr:hypothetical protein [Gammaproteobacteria bacterium]
MVQKVAFIHYAKAAGRFIDYYLKNHVFENKNDNITEQQFKTFNSWISPFYLKRDWNEEELLQLANNRYSAQYPTPDQIRTHYQYYSHDYLSKQYVHNHHHNWTLKSIQSFRRNGWFTFMFIREPSDLLCSLWTWAQNSSLENKKPEAVIQPVWLIDLSLDQFIQEIIGRPEFKVFYALPDYVNEIDYVAEFTEENFRQFLLENFQHEYKPEITGQEFRFSSKNPGYEAYKSQGLISDETDKMINNNVEVQRVREYFIAKSI